MYAQKWSQNPMYNNNVSKQQRKEKIQSILTTTLNKKTKKKNIPLTKMSNSPSRNDYSHIQNYFPFLSWVTKGKNVK